MLKVFVEEPQHQGSQNGCLWPYFVLFQLPYDAKAHVAHPGITKVPSNPFGFFRTTLLGSPYRFAE